jgi:hypothetical protein
MPPIYINTERIDPKKRIFIADAAGGASAEVEALMKKTVIDALVKNATFTTNKIKDAKGYTLEMELQKVDVDKAGNTACQMSTTIRRYPGGHTASVGGISKAKLGPPADKEAILECVKAMVKESVEKSQPVMLKDWPNW